MNERMQPAKAVKAQSSAVILAAVITTGGAVMSAYIQTSGSGQTSSGPSAFTPAEPIHLPQPELPDLARFAPRGNAAANMPWESAFAPARQVALNEPARLSDPIDLHFHAPVEVIERTRPSEQLNWNVAKPAIQSPKLPPPSLGNSAVPAPVVSPWYYLQTSPSVAAAPKASKKFDWGSVSRFFSWHN